jgi:hypothetical protein
MAKTARFSPKNTKYGWCINVPAKYSAIGKRERFFYKTQALAKAAAEDLKEKREKFGTHAAAVPPTLADQATAASALLEPLGIGLLEAVRRFVETETRNRASATIEDATTAFQRSKDGNGSKKKLPIVSDARNSSRNSPGG